MKIARVLPFAFGLLAAAISISAQQSGKQIFQNEYANVNDVPWAAGQTVTTDPKHDTLLVWLTEGDGHHIGEVTFVAKGKSPGKKLAAPARTVAVELSDTPHQKFTSDGKYPIAMPRPGAKKLLDNNRLTAWDYTWTLNQAIPTHFHDKDVVTVYLADGEIKSTTPDGTVTNSPQSFGFAKFNPGGRTHTEMLVNGHGRAIIVELK